MGGMYSFDESAEKSVFCLLACLFKGGISISISGREKIEWRWKGQNVEEKDMICRAFKVMLFSL